MNMVQKLKLKGQINAIEFFGVRLRNLVELEIDLMDDLRSLMSPHSNQVLYQGKSITVNTQNINDWKNYVEQLLEQRACYLTKLEHLCIKGGSFLRVEQAAQLLSNFDPLKMLKEFVYDCCCIMGLTEILLALK